MSDILMIAGVAMLIIIILAVSVWISNKKARQVEESKFRCSLLAICKKKK